jgi:hypothetical protein
VRDVDAAMADVKADSGSPGAFLGETEGYFTRRFTTVKNSSASGGLVK